MVDPNCYTVVLALALGSSTQASQSKNRDEVTTCFSPSGACDDQLIDLVKSATQSLNIAVYDINLDQLVHQMGLIRFDGHLRSIGEFQNVKKREAAIFEGI